MQMLLAIEGQKKSTPNSYTTCLCIDEKNQYAEFLIKISIRIPTWILEGFRNHFCFSDKINNCFWEQNFGQNSDVNYLRNPQPSASCFRQEKLKNNITISQSGILPEKQTLAELVFPVGIPIRNQSEFLSRPLWLQAFWVAIIFTCMYQVPGAWQANAVCVRAHMTSFDITSWRR